MCGRLVLALCAAIAAVLAGGCSSGSASGHFGDGVVIGEPAGDVAWGVEFRDLRVTGPGADGAARAEFGGISTGSSKGFKLRLRLSDADFGLIEQGKMTLLVELVNEDGQKKVSETIGRHDVTHFADDEALVARNGRRLCVSVRGAAISAGERLTLMVTRVSGPEEGMKEFDAGVFGEHWLVMAM